MKCSQFLFVIVSLGVVVLVYLTISAHCTPYVTEASHEQTTKPYKVKGWGLRMWHHLRNGSRQLHDE